MKFNEKIFLIVSISTVCIGFCSAAQKDLGKQDLDPGKAKWESHSEYNIEIKPGKIETHDCNAELTVDYLQFNKQAKVATTVESSDCPVSEGQYTVRLKINDAKGEMQVLEQTEKWRSDGGLPFNLQKYYDIGENAELLRVTTGGLTCECVNLEQPAN